LTLILAILRILSYLPITRELGPTTPWSIDFAAVQSILSKKHHMDKTVKVCLSCRHPSTNWAAGNDFAGSILAQRCADSLMESKQWLPEG
jgi:hypothetical protein